MDCPRCGGNVTVFELDEAVSQVCEDCSYVGVLADHRREDVAIESWDDALTRFQTAFPDSVPDGVARVDDDTTPPENPAAAETPSEDGEFQFRGTPESKTVAESGPEPGIDFPADEPRLDVLERGNATIVAVSDPATDEASDTAGQSDSGGGETDTTDVDTEEQSDNGGEPDDSDAASDTGDATEESNETA